MKAASLAIWFAFHAPIELEQGVHEVKTGRFSMPIDGVKRTEVGCFRIWVSEDQGKTWQFREQISAETQQVLFFTNKDGHYWFILELVYTNGQSHPPKIDADHVSQKVYVNAARRPVHVRQAVARPAPLMVDLPGK